MDVITNQPTALLYTALAAVAPIVGVSVGTWTDKTTWRIDYDPSATDAQKTDAQSVITGFDPSAPANNPVYVATSTMLSRLTQAEYTAIMQASATQLTAGNGQLAHWLDMARTNAVGVNLNDPVTQACQAALVAGGLLTSDRALVVFAP